jgi:tetratricopeptide (TPR) repeat protein
MENVSKKVNKVGKQIIRLCSHLKSAEIKKHIQRIDSTLGLTIIASKKRKGSYFDALYYGTIGFLDNLIQEEQWTDCDYYVKKIETYFANFEHGISKDQDYILETETKLELLTNIKPKNCLENANAPVMAAYSIQPIWVHKAKHNRVDRDIRIDSLQTEIDYGDYLIELGNYEVRFGNYPKAPAYYERCLAILIKNMNPDQGKLANLYHKLGRACDLVGDYNKAVEYYKKCLALELEIFGADDQQVANTYNAIGLVYEIEGIYDQALEYYYQCLSILIKILDSNDPELESLYYDIGVCLMGQLKFNEAIAYFKKGFAIERKGCYPFSIAQCYEGLNEKKQALANYMLSAEIRMERIGFKEALTQKSISNVLRLSKELNELGVLKIWGAKPLSI